MNIFDSTPVKTLFPNRVATTIALSEPHDKHLLADRICAFAEQATEEESVFVEKMKAFMGRGLSLEERRIVGGGYTPVLSVRWTYRLPHDLTAQQFSELIEAYTGNFAYEYMPFLIPPELIAPLILPFQLEQGERHREKSLLRSIDRQQGIGEYIFPVLKDEYPVFIVIGAGPLPRARGIT